MLHLNVAPGTCPIPRARHVNWGAFRRMQINILLLSLITVSLHVAFGVWTQAGRKHLDKLLAPCSRSCVCTRGSTSKEDKKSSGEVYSGTMDGELCMIREDADCEHTYPSICQRGCGLLLSPGGDHCCLDALRLMNDELRERSATLEHDARMERLRRGRREQALRAQVSFLRSYAQLTALKYQRKLHQYMLNINKIAEHVTGNYQSDLKASEVGDVSWISEPGPAEQVDAFQSQCERHMGTQVDPSLLQLYVRAKLQLEDVGLSLHKCWPSFPLPPLPSRVILAHCQDGHILATSYTDANLDDKPYRCPRPTRRERRARCISRDGQVINQMSLAGVVAPRVSPEVSRHRHTAENSDGGTIDRRITSATEPPF
ncbi:hypothetical protein DPEC_G00161330 [Dallia pectoralis]|uniref:Uncharacterized protein n=1 Tax=Dallia pectoralis TaxID=75939 RepID=A0ACC2GGF9_DALPE|nr:hypothetical protein DPEC_G00161330 [Dallia pectoralis]